MDFSKIFLKNACPTAMGGQAILEGVMMRGPERMAIACRVPDGRIHIKTEPIKAPSGVAKIPIVRGIVAFASSLASGMKTLMYSADVAQAYEEDEAGDAKEHGGGAEADAGSREQNAAGGEKSKEETKGRFEAWIEKKFGKRAMWNLMLYLAVAMALLITVGVFILLPTVVVSAAAKSIENRVLLNLMEGLLRITIFVVYIALVSRTADIRRTFEYHGAEHKTIHCFENNLELTPENAQQFYTLHPRCGTSFLMFVMVISLIVFSLVGWPTLWMRLLSRIVLIPLVAGLSYELLKWAGRSDNIVVKILSIPGLELQRLTTREPSKEQLEVAIASVKAVLVASDAPYIEGICDNDGNLLEERHIGQDAEEAEAGAATGANAEAEAEAKPDAKPGAPEEE